MVCAACIALSVSHWIYEWDFWLHLTVGREIITHQSIPTRQLWAWPTYARPDINSSWGFEALVYPFWALGGVFGLFVWRWVSTLAAYTVLWLTARRMGATGLIPLVILVLSALVYRQRAQVRAEMLAAVLLAITLWILQRRRTQGRGGLALVFVMWAWANAHISSAIGFLVIMIQLLNELFQTLFPNARWLERPPLNPRPMQLACYVIGGLALALLNPFGWRALWEPVQMFMMRNEPLFVSINELAPVWTSATSGGVLLMLIAWPILLLWRALRRGLDVSEVLLCVVFSALALLVQRFVGFYALIAAPYMARNLQEFAGSFRWSWPRSLPARSAVASLACILVGVPEWSRKGVPIGRTAQWTNYPIGACDFIEREGIRGRCFNTFYIGSYMLWRWWPDTSRLPFMSTKPEQLTPELRYAYLAAMEDSAGWRALDQRFHFDFVLLFRAVHAGNRLAEVLDHDPGWSLVFFDDAALVYVRQEGPFATIARRQGYQELPGSNTAITELGTSAAADTALRRRLQRELERAARESRYASMAHSLLANIALQDGRLDDATRELRAIAAIDRHSRGVDERLGLIALAQGRPGEALDLFKRERRADGTRRGSALRIAQAHQALGDLKSARSWYQRELREDPGSQSARDSLDSIERHHGP